MFSALSQNTDVLHLLWPKSIVLHYPADTFWWFLQCCKKITFPWKSMERTNQERKGCMYLFIQLTIPAIWRLVECMQNHNTKNVQWNLQLSFYRRTTASLLLQTYHIPASAYILQECISHVTNSTHQMLLHQMKRSSSIMPQTQKVIIPCFIKWT